MQDQVADGVPEPVVELLEVVEVAEQDRKPAAMGLGIADLAPEQVLERAMVDQPGQVVGGRQLAGPLEMGLGEGQPGLVGQAVEQLELVGARDAGRLPEDRQEARQAAVGMDRDHRDRADPGRQAEPDDHPVVATGGDLEGDRPPVPEVGLDVATGEAADAGDRARLDRAGLGAPPAQDVVAAVGPAQGDRADPGAEQLAQPGVEGLHDPGRRLLPREDAGELDQGRQVTADAPADPGEAAHEQGIHEEQDEDRDLDLGAGLVAERRAELDLADEHEGARRGRGKRAAHPEEDGTLEGQDRVDEEGDPVGRAQQRLADEVADRRVDREGRDREALPGGRAASAAHPEDLDQDQRADEQEGRGQGDRLGMAVERRQAGDPDQAQDADAQHPALEVELGDRRSDPRGRVGRDPALAAPATGVEQPAEPATPRSYAGGGILKDRPAQFLGTHLGRFHGPSACSMARGCSLAPGLAGGAITRSYRWLGAT